MLTTIKHCDLVWVNLKNPSAEELAIISQKYDIHPLVLEELASLTVRAKADIYENILYLVLHFPCGDNACHINNGNELDFVIGDNFIITAHYSNLGALEKIFETCKKNEKTREKFFAGNNSSRLAMNLFGELYNHYQAKIDQIQFKIKRIEDEIFDGKEKEMVKNISFLKKEVFDFKRNFNTHENILASFEKAIESGCCQFLFGVNLKNYLNIVNGEYLKIKNAIKDCRETIENLHRTNESLLTTKTNEIMKVLTIMAFITFPLMLFSSIFSMNTKTTPIVGIKWDFWIIIAIMVTAMSVMFLYFKKKMAVKI